MDKSFIASQTARMMLEVQAIQFNAEKPFIFTSGWASPVYVDCRKLISFPRLRRRLMDFAAEQILSEIGTESIDAVAGGETAGIPFSAWLADRLMLPMLYVRKKAKGFGRNAQIEGDIKEGARVLLVEDLTTDGRSKLAFAEALRRAGADVQHTFVIFHYGIFKESTATLAEHGIKMHALATWWDVLAEARERGYFAASTLDEVEKFLHAPAEWSAKHGGKADF
ncbi:orotate phosphoribosyltransferase [Chelatococcus composti]|jgi:orotate phosphoribosyltransferase|uniref:Orotate phosphoribosyltransferase n=1 Tax=Chelatococcus composti TaxID=1743235 RepID=A0A841K7E1_9HYPH|nr:orotate phosphoribosyltransferase [Chelatococcus composti]MBB6168427.1 orotate phosphoribosyltransferase [Chelatococcus composti]MBS7736493.1 orotate phosphoribosyltransferase [Chelatococcus composti]PZN46284.1 MAG: orotate phosphoribosyltransferase [Pseudomonadota bacterium]GGG40005.1 orotate phosphoribosyltransferase [Chelatococcus composti]